MPLPPLVLALVVLVTVHAALSLAVSLVTLERYAREAGGIDLPALLLTLREVTGEAISFIWMLLLLYMWGFINLGELGWQALLPPTVMEPIGQVLALALALLLALYYTLYLDGRLWPAFILALLGTIALQLAFGFQLLDTFFLLAFLIVGITAALAAAAAIFSELRTRL